MKKSLVIISFAFIFLLTLSVVNAGLWITGDVQTTTTRIDGGKLATEVSKTNTETTSSKSTTFSRTSSTPTKAGTSGTTKRTSQAPECPRGWETLLARDGGNCCRKASNYGRAGLFGRKTTATNVASSDSGAQQIKVGDTCTISMGVTGTYQTGSSGTLYCAREASQNQGS